MQSMKVMKAMKKLKFWSRRKRKKPRIVLSEVESLNAPPHCYCSTGATTEPSAPLLPPWLEPHWEPQAPPNFQHRIRDAYPTCLLERYPQPPYVYPQYAVPDHSAEPANGTADHDPDPVTVPDSVPVLVPVMEATTLGDLQRERSTGLLSCVFNFGAHIFHGCFPCFRIQEERFPPLLLPASSHT